MVLKTLKENCTIKHIKILACIYINYGVTLLQRSVEPVETSETKSQNALGSSQLVSHLWDDERDGINSNSSVKAEASEAVWAERPDEEVKELDRLKG